MLTPEEIAAGRSALLRLRAAWPVWCAEVGLAREDQAAQVASSGVAAAGLFAPRNRLGAIARFGAGVVAASMDRHKTPALRRVEPSPLGPRVYTEAGWKSAEEIAARVPRLAEAVGHEIRVEPAGIELALTIVVADPLRAVRAASWAEQVESVDREESVPGGPAWFEAIADVGRGEDDTDGKEAG